MKNLKFRTLNLLYLVFGVVFISSCVGVETPNFTEENPFIVGKVDTYKDTLARYTAKEYTFKFDEWLGEKQSFVAAQNLYNIGDTVRLAK
jgi:hypothetical protein